MAEDGGDPAGSFRHRLFQDLQILSERRMRAIVDDLEAKPEASLSTDEKKLRDLYDAFEDTAAIEANGLKPVQKDLDYLNGLKTPEDVARAMGSQKLATESIYNVSISVDDKHPDSYSINLSQAGLGLPDRDYYLSDDKALVETRTAYKQYLSDMMKLAGMDDADARAARILRWKPRSPRCSGTAPTAAMKTRSIIPCRFRR